MSGAAEATVRTRVEGHVGWIELDNPRRHNALSIAMQERLPPAVEELVADRDVRVVVLRGAGESAFASGADISEFEKRRGDARAGVGYQKIFGRAISSLAAMPKPLIAMIHGYCLGGGLAVALQADMRLAADDAQFAIPAARLGIGYRFEGVLQLVRTVGAATASEILFSARRLPACEALDAGLVNRVVPKAELAATVEELAAAIAENAPLSIRAAKAAIREATKEPGERDLELCRRLVQACFESEDYREGRQAFLDKRPPRFRGR